MRNTQVGVRHSRVRNHLPAILLTALIPIAAATPVAAQSDQEVPTSVPPCIACRANVDMIRNAISKEEWAAVQRGEIITSKTDSLDSAGNKQAVIQSAAILKFPPDEVWTVVIDFESRPRFVPSVKEMKVVRREGNQLWTAEHLRVFLMNIHFNVINTLDPEMGRVTWQIDQSVKNDITESAGSWQIASLPEQRTLVYYRARIESGHPVPGFIEDFLSERSLPKMISGLRDEIGRRFPHLHDADKPPQIKVDPQASSGD